MAWETRRWTLLKGVVMSWKSTLAARAGLTRGLIAWLGRAITRRRRVDPDLDRMSDRELGDLAIGRGEIGWWGAARATGSRDAREDRETDGVSGRR
jgi:uncharacterized protein YjiS (DUF1127 family)